MNKVTCPSALAALTLATVLESEGHPAVWQVERDTQDRPVAALVFTDAPVETIMASIDVVHTALRIPREIN